MTELNDTEREIVAQLEARGFARADRGGRPDDGRGLAFTVPTTGAPTRIVVEVERFGSSPRIEAPGEAVRMVAEPYISPRRAAWLRDQGMPYVDSVGNMWFDVPGYHVEVEGRPRPARQAGASPSTDRLSRPSSIMITFALLTRPDLLQLTLREIATACNTSLGAAQATLADLHQEGFLFGKASARTLRRTGVLAERWASQFRPRLLPKLAHLEARGPAPDWWFDRLGQLPADSGLLGGETAADFLGYPIRATETLIYGSSPWGAVRKAGRLGDDGRSAVHLRERFWPSDPGDPRPVVPSLLVYTDLRDSDDPRLRATADDLRERDDELRRLWAS